MIPLLFAKANLPGIYRSNALAKTPYGERFVYQEGIKADNILQAYFYRALNSASELATKPSILQSKGICKIFNNLISGFMKKTAPASGSGPSKTVQRKMGYWRHLFVGYPEDSTSEDLVYLKMEDNSGDPGYWSTSKMLLECALSLVLNKDLVNQEASLEGSPFEVPCLIDLRWDFDTSISARSGAIGEIKEQWI